MTQLPALRICNGRVIDPFHQRDEIADLAVADGLISDDAPPGAVVFDATGMIVCPGLVDIHVHLREPGDPHKETIETGTAAAAAGGFTFVACMPNTRPALDEPYRVRMVIDLARRAGFCEVGPVAAITRGREGQELTDFAALREAGAVAFSDDGVGVEDDKVMRLAFEQAARLDVLLIQHCEFKAISAGGVMHLGRISQELGAPGLDPRSEEAMIERDLELCRRTGARYHVAHISTARAVELVRRAKADGLAVSAEVCPHHLLLTDAACVGLDPNYKMHPPLRTAADVEACRAGLINGTIDCVATDHAPHTMEEKAVGFLKAPPGVVGLETAVGVLSKALVETGQADWPRLVRWLSVDPANVLGTPHLGIEVGAAANLTLLDTSSAWQVDPTKFLSKGCNTPFSAWELSARAYGTIRAARFFARGGVSGARVRACR